MNLKTTLVLLVFAVAGGVWFYCAPPVPSWLAVSAPSEQPLSSGTREIIEKDLTPQKLRRIEIGMPGQKVVLERGPKGDWTLPGGWPTRTREVDELVTILTTLRSRFAPSAIHDEQELVHYGLDRPTAAVRVRIVDGEQRRDYLLAFGEEPSAGKRFSRATFMRLAEADKPLPEIVKLAPGLAALLDRPLDYYQQRRLFPSERIAKTTDPGEKVDRLVAGGVSARSGASSFALAKDGADWELKEPVRDRPDPDKLQALLTAVPELWAEHFVRDLKPLGEYGLDKPEQTLTVTRGDGSKATLLIGRQSPRLERRPGPPRPSPFGQPMPAEPLEEKYRYAKLEGNDQVFEVKDGKLKDVLVTADSLRDSRLARFKTADVQRVAITLKDQTIVLARKEGKYRLEKPIDSDAEAGKVTEFLEKLAQLDAKGEEILDKGDAKDLSLAPPAGTVAITVEEEVKGEGDDKKKTTRTIKFLVGKHDALKKKLYLRVDDWPRINLVDDELFKLIERPALAYRGRGLFSFSSSELEQIDVARAEEKYSLKKKDGKWRLTAPVDADADSAKANQLASDLANINVVEYVTDAARDEDLEPKYGLGKNALAVTLKLSNSAKPPLTLRIGKQRPPSSPPAQGEAKGGDGGGDFFAKLDGSNQVFAVNKVLRDEIDTSSLTLRPLELWQIPAKDVAALRIQRREEPEYTLRREANNWRLGGPFDASLPEAAADPVLGNLATLKCERYLAHFAKDLGQYGLDKPSVRVVLREADKEKKEAGKEHTLLIGKPVPPTVGSLPGASGRFAKLAASEAIIVVGETLVSAVDRAALDLLDKNLLKIDKDQTITQLKKTNGDAKLTLEQKGERWQADTGLAKFDADPVVVAGVLAVWTNLRAERYAAYGPKADLSAFGLDKPAQRLTLTLQAKGEEGKPAPKPVEHTLILGKPVEGGKGECFARLDNGPGVIVLAGSAVSELSRSHLDFVDRKLLDFDSGAVSGIHRRLGEQELTLVKKDGNWQITKPLEQAADNPALDRLVQELSRLRAARIAALGAKDLKPFGLDEPAAIITIRLALAGGKNKDQVIKLGDVTDDKASGDRFALIDDSDKVAVLPATLVRSLVAKPLFFRDRAIVRFVDADRVAQERGPRKATFARVDGTWKLTEPLEAKAEQAELDDFINALARLRADELVSDKPEDLKPYGLERPEVRWRLALGAKEVLNLLIGDREKAKEGVHRRCYAKLAGSNVVFLLDPKLTERALAEYRSRSLGEPLDAAQVERIDFTAGGGDPQRKSFTLEKLDNVWKLADKADAKINTAAVNETLATVAGLRVERYVVDRDADLKLYGLAPPRLVLEVRTRSGARRVLHIGGREGESKRYYARLPDRSDVFVISEADAARIVRELAAFLTAEKPASE